MLQVLLKYIFSTFTYFKGQICQVRHTLTNQLSSAAIQCNLNTNAENCPFPAEVFVLTGLATKLCLLLSVDILSLHIIKILLLQTQVT